MCQRHALNQGMKLCCRAARLREQLGWRHFRLSGAGGSAAWALGPLCVAAGLACDYLCRSVHPCAATYVSDSHVVLTQMQ